MQHGWDTLWQNRWKNCNDWIPVVLHSCSQSSTKEGHLQLKHAFSFFHEAIFPSLDISFYQVKKPPATDRVAQKQSLSFLTFTCCSTGCCLKKASAYRASHPHCSVHIPPRNCSSAGFKAVFCYFRVSCACSEHIWVVCHLDTLQHRSASSRMHHSQSRSDFLKTC